MNSTDVGCLLNLLGLIGTNIKQEIQETNFVLLIGTECILAKTKENCKHTLVIAFLTLYSCVLSLSLQKEEEKRTKI
jgi:hypothetical protein